MLLAPIQDDVLREHSKALFVPPDPKHQNFANLRKVITAILGLICGAKTMLSIANHQVVGWDVC